MSTPPKTFSHPEIAREIMALTGERVSSSLVGNIRRNDTTSARVSALIERAYASLAAKARKARKPRKVPA
jgi:hypothetical protein